MDDQANTIPANAPIQADTLTITFRKAIECKGLTFTEMKLFEPTAGQMIEWDGLTGTAADIKAVSIVSGIIQPAIEQAGVRDVFAAANFIHSFSVVSAANFTDDPEPEKVIELRKPVTFADVTYTEIRLREPKAIELIDWDRLNGVAADCRIIATVSGLPEPMVRKLAARDLITAAAYLANFIAPPLSAGDRS